MVIGWARLQASSFLVLSLILTVVEVTVISEAQAAPEAIHCGNLLDVRAGRLIEDQVITWDKDGVIIFVGPANSAPVES